MMKILRCLMHLSSRNEAKSWCKLRSRIELLHTSPMRQSSHSWNQWSQPFVLKDPDYDLEYLLNPDNRGYIRENIKHRKGVGDIDYVVDVYKKFENSDDAEEKAKLWKEFLKAAGEIPNRTHPLSPIGEEDAAKCVDIVGSKKEPFRPGTRLKSALQLGEAMHQLRVSNTYLTTGNSTYYFIDKLAMLEHALVNYTVDYLLKKGFELVSVPDLLQPEIIESCGFRTTGDVAQVYRLDKTRHPDLCLVGTSEMSLAGYLMNEVFERKDIPQKLAAVSRCYRAETSTLEQSSGIYRVHQFTKVEMFGVASNEADEGDELLQEFTDIEKTLFTQLGLHFRVLDMPTAELGAPAYRKFDIEAWLPAEEIWGELSSASNCTDFQSRRLNIKYKCDKTNLLKHCTTVNGTACAVPRTILALMETHQNEDGSIELPEVLWKYMDGHRVITRLKHLPKLSWINDNKIKM